MNQDLLPDGREDREGYGSVSGISVEVPVTGFHFERVVAGRQYQECLVFVCGKGRPGFAIEAPGIQEILRGRVVPRVRALPRDDRVSGLRDFG